MASIEPTIVSAEVTGGNLHITVQVDDAPETILAPVVGEDGKPAEVPVPNPDYTPPLTYTWGGAPSDPKALDSWARNCAREALALAAQASAAAVEVPALAGLTAADLAG